MGEGLCSRLFWAKSNLASGRRMTSLTNPDWLKIRQRLEKSYPEMPDMTKVPGYETFHKNAQKIVTELSFFNDITVDVNDFKKHALQLLRDIPSELVLFKLEMNRVIILRYFELLFAYVRVLSLLASIDIRKTVLSLYSFAFFCANEVSDQSHSENVVFLATIDSVQRQFIDDFAAQSQFIGACLLQFYETMRVADDVDQLRHQNVLNPSMEGETMSHPARMMLNNRDPKCVLSIHTELAHCARYHTYALLGFLVCPSLVLHPELAYLNLFKIAVSDTLVVEIFRDLNLNVHNELEQIWKDYPSKKDNVAVPKGFKVKILLKDIAKEAAMTAGTKHRARRSYLLAEVNNLRHLIRAVPGILGPKFPQVHAAAAMAKAEILHYFRNLNQEPRRDVKKHHNPAHFKSDDITILMNSLLDLTNLVEEYAPIVRMYYAEYLNTCDVKALAPIVSGCRPLLESINPAFGVILSSFISDLQRLDPSNGDPKVLDGTLVALRLNWGRISTYIATNPQVYQQASIAPLWQRMNDIYQRSLYVDSMTHLLKQAFVPYEAWWYQSLTIDAYNEALASSLKPLALFQLPQTAILNCHPECPEEFTRIGETASQYCELMLATLGKHIETVVKHVWDYVQVLEDKARPAEAAKRLEKSQQAKNAAAKTGGKPAADVALDQLPGFESEGWARNSIGKLILVRNNLVSLLSDVRSWKPFQVFDFVYDLQAYMRQHASLILESRFLSFVMNKSEMERPSIMMQRLHVGFRIVQSAMSYIEADAAGLLRTILYRNFCDTSLPPPGSKYPLLEKDPPSDAFIWRIATWFVRLAEQAAANDSGLVWAPGLKAFTRTKPGFPVEMYINPEELSDLCCVIGTQGVRSIDCMLLSLIAQKVAALKSFISTNENTLRDFQTRIYQNPTAVASKLENTKGFIEISVVIGVALALREAVHNGLSLAMKAHAPFIHDTYRIATKALDPWQKPSACVPVFAMAHDVGVITKADLGLAEQLSGCITSTDDLRIFAMLPVAYSAALMSPYWSSNITFVPDVEGFNGNQHALALTIAKLFICFIGGHRDNSSSIEAIKTAAETFIELSSNAILAMRNNESEFADRPLRPMVVILELFMQYCPGVDQQMLETFFPYNLIHAAHMDIALGKQKATDTTAAAMATIIQTST